MRLTIFIFAALLFLSACHSFDSKKWKADKSSRQKQAKYLLRQNILSEKSYQDVMQLLGKEDITRFRDTINNLFEIEYILGSAYWIGFDRMAIRFRNGMVDTVYIYDD